MGRVGDSHMRPLGFDVEVVVRIRQFKIVGQYLSQACTLEFASSYICSGSAG
jgi:hypothetical protein